jgi:SAM-dependent methyltransferase
MRRPLGGRLDPETWARVHDGDEARSLLFRRGLELAREVCAPRVRPGDLWVEVGCGPGHLAASLAGMGATVLGIDLDPRMVAYARRRWRQPFAVADAEWLPVANQRCAGVVAVSLLGSLALPASFLRAAGRALAPGGTFCFTAMNDRSLLLLASKLLAWRPLGGARYAAHDPGALTAELLRAGFTPERQILYGHVLTAGRHVLPPPASSRARERSTSPGERDWWARQVLFVARRDALAAC